MISVQIADNLGRADVSQPKLQELAVDVCRHAGLDQASVSIAIVDDAGFRELNKQYLDRDGTSDCLSFDLSDEAERCFEIVVNGELAVAEAAERGHCVEAEIALYIVHGLLHNLGYDDQDDDEARKMHQAEDDLLLQFGYGRTFERPKRRHAD